MTIYHEGKSGVNVKRLVQNIADQYPFEPQKASIIELVANSLDAKATLIEINFDVNNGVLEFIDDGLGMDRGQFFEYHDFAASTKERGSGIGFAGQGAKLALNFCNKVVTETWSATYKGSSEWQLKGSDAPYRISDAALFGLNHFGTKVTLCLNEKSRNFYSTEQIIQILKEHFYPLIDVNLVKFYTGERFEGSIHQLALLPKSKPIYEKGLRFLVNGKQIAEKPVYDLLESQKGFSIKLSGKPVTFGFWGIAKDELPEIYQGVAICVFGKVVDRTWFKKEPREKQKITGWIEAPYLVEAVTTDKCRFQRGNPTWDKFFRKAQVEFSGWLEQVGLMEQSVTRKDDFANLEKEINSILKGMPELTFFGGKTQRSVSIPDLDGEQRELGEGTQKVEGTRGGSTEGAGVSVYPGDESGEAPTIEQGIGALASSHTRTIRGGRIRIAYDERPDKEEEAWFDGETVTINGAHPAHLRAQREKSVQYHVVKVVALSLIGFNLEKEPESSYQKAFELLQRFFRLWGEK